MEINDNFSKRIMNEKMRLLQKQIDSLKWTNKLIILSQGCLIFIEIMDLFE